MKLAAKQDIILNISQLLLFCGKQKIRLQVISFGQIKKKIL